MATNFVGGNGTPFTSSCTAFVETLPEPALRGDNLNAGSYADAKLQVLQNCVETEGRELCRDPRVFGSELEEPAMLIAGNANAMANAFREFHRLLIAARRQIPERGHALDLSYWWLVMAQARWLFDKARRGNERIELLFSAKLVSFLGKASGGWIRALRDVVLEITTLAALTKWMSNLKTDGLMPTVPNNIYEGKPEHDLFPPGNVSEYDAELHRSLDFSELGPLDSSQQGQEECADDFASDLNGEITQPYWQSPWWQFATKLDGQLKALIEAAGESGAFERRRSEAIDVGHSILALWEGPGGRVPPSAIVAA